MRMIRAALAATLGAALTSLAPLSAHADVTTISVDNTRAAWDQNEPNLTPAVVKSGAVGQIFSTAVDGQVYAQPLVVGGTVIVATENNNVYGINATTGAVEWKKNLGPAWPASTVANCTDLVPNIGVTSTPVYDPASNAVYLVNKDNNGATASNPNFYMHALNPSTGAEASGWPVHIGGKAENDPNGVFFNSLTAAQRPGLLLLDGRVYAGFASHCDRGPYRGYIAGVHTTDRALHLWTDEVGQAGGEAGVWQGGGGLASDGSGRIFFSTGNGTGPAAAPSNRPPAQLGDSVVRVDVDPSTGVMHAADFFAPDNAPTLASTDQDLGSGGPVVLPSTFGTTADPNVLAQIGKDGRLFLLNRDKLGGRSQGGGAFGKDAVLDINSPNGGVWGHPGVWGGDGGYVYIAENNGHLRAYTFDGSSGTPDLKNAWISSSKLGSSPGSPVVTSDGTTSGSATVWEETGANTSNGQLCAYDAAPSGGNVAGTSESPMACFGIGAASKFAVPATDNGIVYVGNHGHLLAFGAGGWHLNGAATMNGSTITLTPATANVAGSAVSGRQVASDGLSAAFDSSIGGGTGGDGLTFAMLDPSKEGVNALGGTGHEFGFGGLSGVAVGLVTHRHLASEPTAPFVGVSIGAVSNGSLVWTQTTNTNVPNLRSGTHHVVVTVSGGTMTVTIDGTTVLSAVPVTLPADILPAFTAGNGSLTDVHAVQNITIS